MKHIYQKGTNENAPTLLLLHGTGGDERDLLPLADMIAPGASVLSVKGNVSENGMPRFFARLAEGVFDEEDLVFRTKELKDFIDNSAVEHGFNRDRVVALGYSNGANIAGSMVYHYEDVLAGAILFHAMVPRRGVDIPALENLPVFVGAGTRDPIIPKSETEELILHLKESGADVTEYWTNGGHELRREEVDEAARWFQNHFVK
ncbi:alpha/beta hydrolase [Rossellomorea marisflavi]|uniref:alpha/beta hydrolase n=1 Tax=Rossellomorea marisflavi TaxID=189381 RepID=UPI00064ECABA|nr:alpha/beta hydrolase [Rossellomorea marisflavi]KMK96374.1 carboxylesterase [Rossellomorea marisflavi]KML06587.1 carboxylesterase [Rossellomorea marisflavi]KML32971.1 carboxylesterase [Rossellomorea marisflavi]TYO72464.1 alpha/beta hydrolase [Rossellomorea marisflavi]USK94237.1 alpha/beta hydrolase [Rossellomorea marisflavi]